MKKCNAPNCHVEIDETHYFCWYHWNSLDDKLQNNLVAAYTPGQETDKRRIKKKWHILMRRARFELDGEGEEE